MWLLGSVCLFVFKIMKKKLLNQFYWTNLYQIFTVVILDGGFLRGLIGGMCNKSAPVVSVLQHYDGNVCIILTL